MSSSIRIELDHEADAAYIVLSERPVARTRQLTPEVLVDLDEFEVAVGIEVLGLDASIPFDVLVSELHIHSDVIEVIKLIRPSVQSFVLRATSASAGSVHPNPVSTGHLIPA